jgi:hypothetical protein
MPGVGFERTIPVFERAKIFHTLDRAVTVISRKSFAFTLMRALEERLVKCKELSGSVQSFTRHISSGARGDVIGWGTMLQARKAAP